MKHTYENFYYFGKKLQIILGKKSYHETKLDQDLVQELVTLGSGLPFNVVSGKTVCTDDFYEGTLKPHQTIPLCTMFPIKHAVKFFVQLVLCPPIRLYNLIVSQTW